MRQTDLRFSYQMDSRGFRNQGPWPPEQYARVYETFGVPLHPRVLLYGLFPGIDIEDGRAFEAWLRSYVALFLKETWKHTADLSASAAERARPGRRRAIRRRYR